MNLFCKLLGHKFLGAESYLSWGLWSATDGVGVKHRSLMAYCTRCEDWCTVGRVQMPDRPMPTMKCTPAQLRLAEDIAVGLAQTVDDAGMLVPIRVDIEILKRIAVLVHGRTKPDYAWPTVADYEKDGDLEVNFTFKAGWNMGRMTNDHFGTHESKPQEGT